MHKLGRRLDTPDLQRDRIYAPHGFQNSDSCPEMSRFPGGTAFWLPTSSVDVCTRLAGGLVRTGIKEIEKVSHG